MVAPSDGFAKVKGIRIHYVEWGGGEPTLLLVPGLAANARMWDLWAESLAPRYRLIALDLRGRGDSDKEGPYGVEVHAADIEPLLNALHLDKVVYIGNSFGAIVGLQFAANYPSRVHKLVLGDEGGVADDEAERDELIKSVRMAISNVGTKYPSREAYWDFCKAFPLYQRFWSKHLETALEATLEVLPDGTARRKVSTEAIEEDLRDVFNLDYGNLYPRITCPTLLLRAPLGMFGEKDCAMSPEVADRIVRSIPNCRLYEAEGTDHFTMFMLEQPELIQEVIRFVDE